MQADIEIQSAAKLPTRHLRRSRVTGARSSLYKWLNSRSGKTAGSTSGAIGLEPPLTLKMRWLALEVSAAAKFTNELAVARRNLSPYGNDMWPPLNFETFK